MPGVRLGRMSSTDESEAIGVDCKKCTIAQMSRCDSSQSSLMNKMFHVCLFSSFESVEV